MDAWQIVVQVVIGFVLGILASTKIVPWILERQQRRLAKSLLKHWGGDCIGAMMRLKPPSMTRMHIEGYTNPGSDDYVLTQLWNDIKEGRRKPDGIAMVIYQSLENMLYTEEELQSKEPPPEQKIQFFPGDPEVPRAMIKRILNPMYANLEIFDLELLPINELEMAVSDLEGASQKGYYTRSMYDSYALHLAQSMEKFAKYLWKLEKWQTKHKSKIGESKMIERLRPGSSIAFMLLGIPVVILSKGDIGLLAIGITISGLGLTTLIAYRASKETETKIEKFRNEVISEIRDLKKAIGRHFQSSKKS